MKPNPESLDGKPPPKRYRWWRFIEHSLPIIIIYLMVATLVELPDRSERDRHRADRPCRHPVEAFPRRHAARPAPAQGRGHARAAAVGQAVPVRPAAADPRRHLQRHLQGRREPDRDDQYPVPAEARRGAAASPDHRAELHRANAEPGDRQPGARNLRRIHRRGDLFDQAPGDSAEDPHAHQDDARQEHDAADRGRRANTASTTGCRWTR